MEVMECQSCGMPMECEEDHADCDVTQEFCKYCMVKGEFTIKNREEMKRQLALKYEETFNITSDEAMKRAEDTLSRLKRWRESE